MSDAAGEIHVREATVVDTLALVRFNECLALETENVRLDRTKVVAGVRAVLDDRHKGTYLVAERGGTVIGGLLITYEWSDWRNATFIWIQSVYVEPSHRRQGVFRRLFQAVLHIGESPAYCGVRLYMEDGNANARAAYGRLGLEYRGYVVLDGGDPLREAH
jgi:GNAT superfamily N-acetyltransferase